MKRALVISALMLLAARGTVGQDATHWAVLPESAAQDVAHLCSRPGPPAFEATWLPGEADVAEAEARLGQVSRLRSRGGINGAQVLRPRKYYRQYVGIVVKGRRLIYLNAICEDTAPDGWRERVMDVCDGGCNWGAVYEPDKRRFADLTMNGVA